MENSTEENPKLIKFPCEFIIKAMGKNNDEFAQAVFEIINKHYPSIKENDYKKNLSKDDNYLALSVMVSAESQEQLDACYQDLSDNKLILMAL